MKNQVKPIPEGFHTLTPHIVVKGADKAIEFYKKAFGAKEVGRMPGPDGATIMHADIIIGDSHLMLVDEFPEMGCLSPQSTGGSPVTIHIYVEDVDTFFKQAINAGAQEKIPLTDMFWGDRYGMIADPFGHSWSIATHKEDLTAEEMKERSKSAFGANQ